MSWHERPWSFVAGRLDAGQLPHALLIGGEQGVGKRAFADRLAHSLVCERTTTPDYRPCGGCKQCELVQAGTHPDIRIYAPEKSRMIKVDQVRALSAFAVASPQVARRKLIVIDRADQLNINAANALLKTLEEPSADVVLLLLQETGRPILPTLRSRCQALTIATPGPDEAARWLSAQLESQGGAVADEDSCRKALAMARFAPRLALDYLAGDYLAMREEALSLFRRFMKSEVTVGEAAKPFKTLGAEPTLWLMELWAADLARLGAGGSARDEDAAEMLAFLARTNPPWRAHQLLDSIRESRSALVYNASPELEAERLLIEWQALMPRRQRRAG
ncbi:MAG: DNA polymerase III subunit delta' [Marinobacter sp.]|uniref:DNA polymerase III subunit delta' n=1 Tax=Marinobacter sp. TaxID=50741 RepID=UPI00299EA943|nr:DNA polymerase III subunit delta' [Marinobacter sp.]MDX1633144.1 DNA polymerase III subunit delta' [Marinobacter sp.]